MADISNKLNEIINSTIGFSNAGRKSKNSSSQFKAHPSFTDPFGIDFKAVKFTNPSSPAKAKFSPSRTTRNSATTLGKKLKSSKSLSRTFVTSKNSNFMEDKNVNDLFSSFNSKNNVSFTSDKLNTVEKFNLNNSTTSGKSFTNFKKEQIMKDINLFSNHLQRNINPVPLANFINRPTVNLNRPDLNMDMRSYLMNSPTNINKNNLVTSNLMRNYATKQKKLNFDNIWNRMSSGKDDSFESFKSEFYQREKTDSFVYSEQSARRKKANF